jgi:hypothetical protein
MAVGSSHEAAPEWPGIPPRMWPQVVKRVAAIFHKLKHFPLQAGQSS